ncbi:MAG: nickel-dependent hydrogenase large subunit [Desulfobacteraceae bacterium]|jgi:coenzyme F420-reducing hydrogenase alpha subunit
MKINLNVDVHHLTRVEGHGNIKVKVENGEVKDARWDVIETPRFFEAMLRNKHYTTAGILAARICGICSISHCLCSITATEQAFDVTVPE